MRERENVVSAGDRDVCGGCFCQGCQEEGIGGWGLSEEGSKLSTSAKKDKTPNQSPLWMDIIMPWMIYMHLEIHMGYCTDDKRMLPNWKHNNEHGFQLSGSHSRMA